MGYFVTDPSLIALANAGLPPDEQVGAYYQMDEHEIARAAARRDLWRQPTSVRAAKFGLSIGQFNSGAKRNPANGFRVFRGGDGTASDYFAGGHIAHLSDLKELEIWLSGYAAGRAV
jgi:hypothetical protein